MELKHKILTAAAAAVITSIASLTMQSEGEVLKTYVDPIGIPTLCYGHTGPDVVAGRVATHDECKALLYEDLAKALAEVDRCVPGLPMAPRAAFTDFVFNVGGSKFCSSTMAKKARAGDMPGACAELSRWVYAGGKELPGLVTRRAKERAICEGKA
ncbi:lysozyme [Chitinimonas naiadis]